MTRTPRMDDRAGAAVISNKGKLRHCIPDLKEKLRKLAHLIADEDDCRIEVFDQISDTLNYLKNLKFSKKPCRDEPVPIPATSLSQKLDSITVPDYFLCPISSELMREPVMLATGQTYDRPYIQAWLDADHRTCPKTQQVLPNLILTPNYLVRTMIEQWCESHGLEPPMQTANLSTESDGITPQERKYVMSLLDRLSGDYQSMQREAARELRLLTKKKPCHRAFLGEEAGAVPVLVPLLLSPDSETQEHVVTTLLNLSIHEGNKILIADEGAIEPMVEVLREGSTAARENAAAALFSLSAVDENKVRIGASGAISALVDLMRDGNSRGKKDAASALFNLCIYQGNKAKTVRAGVVPVLMKMISKQSEGMGDEALAIMAIVSSHHDGAKAIGCAGALPLLMDFMKNSSPRNKENAVVILLELCTSEPSYLKEVRNNEGGGGYMALVDLSVTGTPRARRKASALIDRMTSNCRNANRWTN
eukprot:Gb_24088 [translate_table: standard]